MLGKSLVLSAFRGEETEYVPTGFWCPWLTPREELVDGITHPEFVESVIQHHKEFIRNFKPDILKIMTAGFFTYPGFNSVDFNRISTLAEIQPLGKEHPWIREQVRLSRELSDELKDTGVLLYSIFTPFTYLKLNASLQGINELEITDLLIKKPEVFRHVSDVITNDFIALAEAVIKEGRADGIYFCVSNLKTPELTKKLYKSDIAPDEKRFLNEAAKYSPYNVLHICGNDRKNDFSLYKDYNAAVFNWAATNEGISLREGKKIFSGKTVLGGFDNSPTAILHQGTKAEIEEETKRILREAGTDRVILGADCAIPPTIDKRHLLWVREAAKEYSTK